MVFLNSNLEYEIVMTRLGYCRAYPIGLPAWLNSFRTLSASSFTSIFAPSTANELLRVSKVKGLLHTQ